MSRILKLSCLGMLGCVVFAGAGTPMLGQVRSQDAALIARRNATEKELESVAII